MIGDPTAIPELREYRGLSYPIGGDDDAITLPNILAHYSPGLRGMSRGSHLPVTVLRPEQDGLNAAVGGSLSASLLGQVQGGFISVFRVVEVWEARDGEGIDTCRLHPAGFRGDGY